MPNIERHLAKYKVALDDLDKAMLTFTKERGVTPYDIDKLDALSDHVMEAKAMFDWRASRVCDDITALKQAIEEMEVGCKKILDKVEERFNMVKDSHKPYYDAWQKARSAQE